MLQVGASVRQARETQANARFRNLNSAVLMQRLTLNGAVIDAGLTSTHLAVIQVIAAHTPRTGWHLEGEGAETRLVSGVAYPSQALIAQKVGRSERQVKTLIRQVAAAGFVTKEMTVEQRRDAQGGTIPIRRNFYRLRLPVDCAADGADGVRGALEPESQLRLARPDTSVPASPRRGSEPPHGGEAHFPTEGKPTSHDPSVPSVPSAAAAAVHSNPRCEGIPTPDGGFAAVALRRPPNTDGRATGGGVVEATGEKVAVSVEAWNLACEGRGSELRLQARQRDDGSPYLWLDRAPRESRAQGGRARQVPSDGSWSPEGPATVLSVQDVALFRWQGGGIGTGKWEVLRCPKRGTVQLLAGTMDAFQRNERDTVTVAPYRGFLREIEPSRTA